ncbi:MAG: hypothetical protein EPO24_05890 [Bacteroidetes bacterium]|nr:MAG: hypothetical protein EPO24_05890 [Bacteroidota bacterium]
MRKLLTLLLALVCCATIALSQGTSESKDEQSKNLRQYYSGKVGFYKPAEELNNGLLLGIDGITEFTHYNFFLSGSLDLYMKQTFDFFQQPKPDVQQQQIFLLPLHVNFGYKIFDVRDADTRGYLGFGGGYYFYFYSVDYQTSGGFPPSFTTHSDSKNGGDLFATIFARFLLGKVFVEPRFYMASTSEDNISSYKFEVDPSGFAITIGFQQ